MATMTKTTAADLQVWNDGSDEKAYVLGHQFGACLVAITDSLDAAFDEFDERFGERVKFDGSDDTTLSDYHQQQEDETIDDWRVAAVDKATECGDIRINDGGTVVWADHYEWIREFDSIGAAFAFAFGLED